MYISIIIGFVLSSIFLMLMIASVFNIIFIYPNSLEKTLDNLKGIQVKPNFKLFGISLIVWLILLGFVIELN